jgi:hypothetical protein
MVEARVDGVVRETADLLNDQKKEISKVVELLSQSARRDDVVKALEGKADAEEVGQTETVDLMTKQIRNVDGSEGDAEVVVDKAKTVYPARYKQI